MLVIALGVLAYAHDESARVSTLALLSTCCAMPCFVAEAHTARSCACAKTCASEYAVRPQSATFRAARARACMLMRLMSRSASDVLLSRGTIVKRTKCCW